MNTQVERKITYFLIWVYLPYKPLPSMEIGLEVVAKIWSNPVTLIRGNSIKLLSNARFKNVKYPDSHSSSPCSSLRWHLGEVEEGGVGASRWDSWIHLVTSRAFLALP